jgi:hypothetical protein
VAGRAAGDASDKGSAAGVAMRTGIERPKTGIDDSDALIRRIKNAGIEVSDGPAPGWHEADAGADRDARLRSAASRPSSPTV